MGPGQERELCGEDGRTLPGAPAFGGFKGPASAGGPAQHHPPLPRHQAYVGDYQSNVLVFLLTIRQKGEVAAAVHKALEGCSACQVIGMRIREDLLLKALATQLDKLVRQRQSWSTGCLVQADGPTAGCCASGSSRMSWQCPHPHSVSCSGNFSRLAGPIASVMWLSSCCIYSLLRGLRPLQAWESRRSMPEGVRVHDRGVTANPLMIPVPGEVFLIKDAIDEWHMSGGVAALTHPPHALCLQVERYFHASGRVGKRSECLCLADRVFRVPTFMPDGIRSSSTTYQLVAVIVDLGPTPQHGQYRCLLWHPQRLWYITEDGVPSSVPTPDELSMCERNAYILFATQICICPELLSLSRRSSATDEYACGMFNDLSAAAVTILTCTCQGGAQSALQYSSAACCP